LPYLIRFGNAALSLKVDHIVNASLHKYMMASPCSLVKAKTLQEMAQVIEINGRIRPSA